jgi:hypothetical protein
MRVTEEDLRRLYEESTVPRDAAECPDTGLLIRAAAKRLGEAEREAVSGHIARCSECARAYRVARTMRPLTDHTPRSRRAYAFAAGAIAATLLLFLPAMIWFTRLREQDRATIAALERRPVAVAVSTPVPVDDFTRPQLDAPIIDLDSDVTRGTESAASVVVPANVDLFTTILHLDAPAREIDVTIDGPAQWTGSWQAANPTATLPLTLHRKGYPSGAYVVRVRAGGRESIYRFRVDWR